MVRILLEEGAPERTVVSTATRGGVELARICNKQGWYMRLRRNRDLQKLEDIQESLRVARPELILAETDAPF